MDNKFFEGFVNEILDKFATFRLVEHNEADLRAVFMLNTNDRFTLKLVRKPDYNYNIVKNEYHILIENATSCGQDLNITSLRRHRFSDYDDGRTWKYDAKGNSAERYVFMRTHNKLYEYTTSNDYSRAITVVRCVDHAIALSINAFTRNNKWNNAAIATKHNNEQLKLSIKDLLAFESRPAFIDDCIKAVYNDDYDYNDDIIIDNKPRYISSTNITLYDTYALVEMRARVLLNTGEKFDKYTDTVLSIDYTYRFDIETNTFAICKENAALYRADFTVDVDDCLSLHVNLPYDDDQVKGTIEDIKPSIVEHLTLLRRMMTAKNKL